MREKEVILTSLFLFEPWIGWSALTEMNGLYFRTVLLLSIKVTCKRTFNDAQLHNLTILETYILFKYQLFSI